MHKLKWLIVPLGITCILAILSVVLRVWLAANLEDILNNDPERKYNIEIQKVRIQPFWRGIRMHHISIVPARPDSTTVIRADVELARLNHLYWSSLLLHRELEITSMEFFKPHFAIVFVEDTATADDHPAMEMRQLFGDILSRGKLHTFSIVDGNIEVRNADSNSVFFRVDGFSVHGVNIRTDSLQWRRLIPFSTDELTISFDTLGFETGAYTQLGIGRSVYHENPGNLILQNLHLRFTDDVHAISDRLGIQKDLITCSMEDITFDGVSMIQDSNMLSGLQVRKIMVNGLDLHDYRDKQKPRPPEPVKPLLAGMIRKIPLPIAIDTIMLENARIAYSERPEQKTEFGTLEFAGSSAEIYRLTNVKENEMVYRTCEIHVNSRINKEGTIKGHFTIPYGDTDQFALRAEIGPMPLHILNSTLHPLAGVMVQSGNLVRTYFSMEAFSSHAQSHLVFDYDDLKIEILNRQDKKSGLTFLANPLMRSTNLPGEKNYRTRTYSVERNIYRGPFNFMWNSLKEGLMLIIPSGTALKLAGGQAKSKEAM